MSSSPTFRRVDITTMDPEEFVSEAKQLDLQLSKDQLGQCFLRERTNTALDVVKSTNFIGALAKVMSENLQWAREEPKWIENIVYSIYYYMQWKIPLDQTQLLLEVAKKYLKEHESVFSIALIHRILTPIGNKLVVLNDTEVYLILKQIALKGGSLIFNAKRCLQAAVLNSSEWQLKILKDPEFVLHLLENPDETTWAFLSIVAQHFDAKLLFPSEVYEKAKWTTKIEHCENICAILSNEIDPEEVLEYVSRRVQRLEELLAIKNMKGKVFSNSLLSLVLPFVNLSISDVLKEPLGEKLVSPLLGVLRINKDEPLILKIAYCLERSKQEASRVLFNLAFNDKNLDRIEAEGGMELLTILSTSYDSKVKRNATAVIYMLEKRRNTGSSRPTAIPANGHVMVSYNWANQSTIKRLVQSLTRSGFRVWVDYEQMEGSTLEAMAQAVEGSAIILMCFSQKYKDSPNCRLEAEYCMKRGINFIPLRLQKGYKPDGWLGIAMGNKIYHDFTSEDDWNQKIQRLMKEMTFHMPTTAKNELVWSLEELRKWMEAEDIVDHYQMFVHHNITHKALLELKELLKSDQRGGLGLLRAYFGLMRIGDVLSIAAAVKKFNWPK